jgi:poly(A) polymerase
MTSIRNQPSQPPDSVTEPRIVPRAQHPISRKKITPNAVKILYRLKNNGYTAYLAGGAVRDLLLGKTPADFDIVTNATPRQIKRLFRNSRIIGRRFRLVHIYFHKAERPSPQIFEVATFRRAFTPEQDNPEILEQEPSLANNLFGTPAEDAIRRDFTINALFYNIADFTVIDHVNGLSDLKQGIIRIIGDPNQRFTEDPVRILRALEFSCRLGFKIEEKTARSLVNEASSLSTVPAARLREELRGFYCKKNTAAVLEAGRYYQINHHWLPESVTTGLGEALPILRRAEDFFPLRDNDRELERVIITALIFPALLGEYPVNSEVRLNLVQEKVEELLQPLNRRFNLPRVQRYAIRDILTIFYRLSRGDKRIKQLLKRENFFTALFFYAVVAAAADSQAANLAFWQQRRERLNRHPEARGRDYGKLLTTTSSVAGNQP